MDVLASAAGSLPVRGRSMIIELQRDAHYIIALALENRRDD
jgi:hypothetical protein